MQYFKLQFGCLLVVLYITFAYFLEKKTYKIKKREPIFESLLIFGILSIVFDGITAYTVNHLETVPPVANRIFHLCFLCLIDTIVFIMFLYILDISSEKLKSCKNRLIFKFPFIINLLVVIFFIPSSWIQKRRNLKLFNGSQRLYLFCDGSGLSFCHDRSCN